MIELENHDRRVRGEPARQPQAARPKPTRKAPTARCVPWTDAHYLQLPRGTREVSNTIPHGMQSCTCRRCHTSADSST
eukprot:2068812-Amphidinium_carterae.1